MEDVWYVELAEVVIVAWVVDQALGRASGKGGDAVVDALARHWREPTIRQRKLGCHVVVVVEKALVVIAHRALASQISKITGACSRTRAAICEAFCVVDKAIHIDGTGRKEIVGIDVSVACRPGRCLIVDAGALEFEQRIHCALIVRVAGRAYIFVNAIHGIGRAVVADAPAVCHAVGIQHAEIIVEGVILLQHEEDVIDGLNRARLCHGYGRTRRGAPSGSSRSRGVDRRLGWADGLSSPSRR